jgi:hypothetical protein
VRLVEPSGAKGGNIWKKSNGLGTVRRKLSRTYIELK